MQPIRHLVILGVGLIGGSLARALRAAGAVQRITGVGRGEANLKRAVELGVIDDYSFDASAAVQSADMVFVAVPLGAFEALFAEIAPHLPKGCIVTDGGSSKASVLAAARRHLPGSVHFVAGHPLAGTENSGVEASFAELYRGRLCLLTPSADTETTALARVRWMWAQCGARVELLDAAAHDRMLAAVSHLPHVAAFALVNAVCKMSDEQAGLDPFRYAAGGFRDFTRIASSSPEMWRDIALHNREALLGSIEGLRAELAELHAAIAAGDGERLLNEFAAAKAARDGWLARQAALATGGTS